MSQPKQSNNLERFNADLALLLVKHGFGIENLDTVSVIISQKKGLPAVFLRKNTTKEPLIKALISAAYHGRPVIIMPQFTNKLQSINSALEKGILCRDGNGGYRFTF